MKQKILRISLVLIIVASIIAGAIFLMNKSETPPQTPKEFSNGQPYAVFRTDRFEVKYPDWPNIDVRLQPDADKLKVAVSSEGCNLFVKEKDLPDDLTLESYTQKVISDFGDKITVATSDVKDGRASLDADIDMGSGAVMRNVSRVYQIGNTLYSIAFISEKTMFPNACQPIFDEVVASVKVLE